MIGHGVGDGSRCRSRHPILDPPRYLDFERRRRQILDDETKDRLVLNIPEREDTWVKDFIARLAGVIRSDSGKS
jgi:hypothetical protein